MIERFNIGGSQITIIGGNEPYDKNNNKKYLKKINFWIKILLLFCPAHSSAKGFLSFKWKRLISARESFKWKQFRYEVYILSILE